jgi:capsid protein
MTDEHLALLRAHQTLQDAHAAQQRRALQLASELDAARATLVQLRTQLRATHDRLVDLDEIVAQAINVTRRR